MKKLLSLLMAVFLMPALASAQTKQTYTGTIKDLSGAVVTSGQVTFTLTPSVGSTISGIGRFVPTTATCKIMGDGSLSGLVSGVPSGACQVVANISLSAGGTSYRICEQPYFSTPGQCFYDYALGGTKDISSIAPTLTTGPLNYSGIPGPPLSYLGAWSSSTTYQLGQVVSYSTGTYISLTATNLNNIPSSSPSSWSLVVSPGGVTTSPTADQVVAQPSGTSLRINRACIDNNAVNVKSCFNAKADLQFTLRCSIFGASTTLTCGTTAGALVGVWNISTTYSLGQEVTYGSKTYISQVNSNTGNAPSSDPADWSTTFAAADVGKTIYVSTAGTSGATLTATIASVQTVNTVTLSSAAISGVTNAPIVWATDDTAALQAAYNYAVANSKSLYIPSGSYLHHGLNFTGQGSQHVLTPSRIYGDAYSGGTDLYAMGVANPGRVNSGWTVGVDLSATSYNEVDDLTFFGGINTGGFADLAPQINVFAGRVHNTGGGDLAVGHSFERLYSETFGQYGVVLYGYEQVDFHNSHFQMDGSNALAALYLSSDNTPGFSSPYLTIKSPTTTMTKVNISGARTAFIGVGNMIVLDQGAGHSLGSGIYTVSIRDAYASMAPAANNKCDFLSDTSSSSPIRHIVVDTVYIEVQGGASVCRAINLQSPAWNWRVESFQTYGTAGPYPIAPFVFAGGFLDSTFLGDATGGYGAGLNEFMSPTCAGSVIHLGQQQPGLNCTDYLSATFVPGTEPGPGGILPQNITAQFQGSGPTAGWWKLGTWVGAAPGTGPTIVFNGGNGYNTGSNSEATGFITLRLGNNTSSGNSAPNLSGIASYATGNAFAGIKAVATGGSTSVSNMSWDIYVNERGFSQFTYTVNLPSGSYWIPLNAASSDPGAASSTVVVGTVNVFSSVPQGTTPVTKTCTTFPTVVNGVVTGC